MARLAALSAIALAASQPRLQEAEAAAPSFLDGEAVAWLGLGLLFLLLGAGLLALLNWLSE